MPAEQKSTDTSTTKELSEIRREVIEARNLVIKTDNLLKNLHVELKTVGSKQEDFQKRQWRSSAMAYALFAILALGGGFMYASARTSSANSDHERMEREVADLTAQMDKLKAEARAQEQAEKGAAEVYKMMTVPSGDERLKGVDALVKLDTSRLSQLEKQALNDRAQLLRKEVGQAAFERGKSDFRKNDMAGAVNELSRFMAMNPEQADAVDAAYFLGSALNGLKKHEQAIPYLSRFVTEDRKAKTREYAMVLLAQSYEMTGQLDKAAETARDGLNTYPAGEFAQALRFRLNAVRRMQSTGADSPAAVQVQPAAAAPVAKPPVIQVSPAAPAKPVPAPAH